MGDGMLSTLGCPGVGCWGSFFFRVCDNLMDMNKSKLERWYLVDFSEAWFVISLADVPSEGG